MGFEPSVVLLFPDSDTGDRFSHLAHFAARRARSMKTGAELWEEVVGATEERRRRFLRAILKEEWSLDVAEMSLFIFDIERVPSWIMTEFLRHRLIARDWSFEQRSKRAIYGERIPVLNPFEPDDAEGELAMQMDELIARSQELMADAHRRGVPPEKLRYACLEGAETSFVAAANARALHHLFTMRGSTDIGGDGKAAPEFMALVDEMYRQANAVCPQLFGELLRS